MRLLNVYSMDFCEVEDDDDAPPYVIASHRWCRETEATYQEVLNRQSTEKLGYRKVESFANYVRNQIPHLQWLWIDTCCIDRTSSTELSEAIISMFRWYRNSEVCLAYLRDVDSDANEGGTQFYESQWFQRGWTLQELLAPRVVVFLTSSWRPIGHKGANKCKDRGSEFATGPSLEHLLYAITRIPVSVLRDYEQSQGLSVEARFAWAAGRHTSRKEDQSYCLLGIFDVSMPILYGEGRERARSRLRDTIEKDAVSTKQRSGVSYRLASPAGMYALSGLAAQLRPPTKSPKLPMSTVKPQPQQQSSIFGSSGLKCPTCKKSFSGRPKLELEQHRRDTHGSIFPNDCPLCKHSFQSLTARNQHMQTVHTSKHR